MSAITPSSKTDILSELTTVELAQVLAQRLAISDRDWHRLKGNRQAQAQQQLASALVFLLKNNPETASIHLQQAISWLDGSLASPPCPDRDRHKK